MQTVIIRLANGILKVAELPNDTRVVLEDVDAGTKTTYKKEKNGSMWKKHSRIKEEVKDDGGYGFLGIRG